MMSTNINVNIESQGKYRYIHIINNFSKIFFQKPAETIPNKSSNVFISLFIF